MDTEELEAADVGVAQVDDGHSVFSVGDDAAEIPFEPCQLDRVKVTDEDGVLESVSECLHLGVHQSETLVVGYVICNEESSTAQGYLVQKATYAGTSPSVHAASNRACTSNTRRYVIR